MSNYGEYESALIGAPALSGSDLLGVLRSLIERGEYSLEWRPGCPDRPGRDDCSIQGAWFELERGGAWIVAQEVLHSRPTLLRIGELLARPLRYYEAKASIDAEREELTVHAFDCVGSRLSTRPVRKTDVHDGNTDLIVIEAAELTPDRIVRGSALRLYPVKESGLDENPPSEPTVTEPRLNLKDLWKRLSNGDVQLRRIDADSYLLTTKGWVAYLGRNEVDFVRRELNNRALPPLVSPSLETESDNESIRWVRHAFSSPEAS